MARNARRCPAHPDCPHSCLGLTSNSPHQTPHAYVNADLDGFDNFTANGTPDYLLFGYNQSDTSGRNMQMHLDNLTLLVPEPARATLLALALLPLPLLLLLLLLLLLSPRRLTPR
jgi:hypothetical protein